MVTTVNIAFSLFLQNTVNLDSSQTEIARNSRDWMLKKIHSFHSNNDDFPLLYDDYHINFGSFSRRTKIRPLDDIDLMICLGADSCTYNDLIGSVTISTGVATSRLQKYTHEGNNNVNSRKIINTFISELKKIGQYNKAEINRRQEAATLNLVSYDWNFDIVPCFITRENSAGKSFYLIPDGDGNWKKTDPRIDKYRTTTINQQHDGKMLNVIRLIKYWQKRKTMPTMGSYLLETILLNYHEQKHSIGNYIDLEIAPFLRHLSNAVFYDVNDHKGFQGNINNLDYDAKIKISSKALSDATKAESAWTHEKAGSHKEAINIWREIFGNEFPTYE